MRHLRILTGLLAFAATPLIGAGAQAAGAPAVSAGYTISVFAKSPGGASRPDSLAMVGDHVWVGYGGTGKPDGSGGAVSQIVEYDAGGKLLRNLRIVGHNDGLRLDPATGKLWAIQNEDGDANIVLISPGDGSMSKPYLFKAGAHGGGYDDVAFIGGDAYVSASNPSTDNGAKNPGPSVVKAVLQSDQTVAVTPALAGTPTVVNVADGKASTLNLTDPDSLTVTPEGDLMLDSQGDGQLLWMHPGSSAIRMLPLRDNVQVDDTAFVTGTSGFLLFTDTKGETVYKIGASSWKLGAAYSASNGVEATTTPPVPAVPAYIGQLDLETGALVPVAEHLVSPHGMIFVGTGK